MITVEDFYQFLYDHESVLLTFFIISSTWLFIAVFLHGEALDDSIMIYIEPCIVVMVISGVLELFQRIYAVMHDRC